MSCQFTPDFQIAPNVTYSQFDSSFDDNLVCPATYLRPDPGGALLPWLYTLFLLLFHLPACIIRAVRWESAQYLALGLALFNIAVTIQAYVSTKLDPAKVLVWMPLTLMLDIGAMLQMVILILEMDDHSVVELKDALVEQTRRIASAIKDGFHRSEDEAGRLEGSRAPTRNSVPLTNGIQSHELSNLSQIRAPGAAGSADTDEINAADGPSNANGSATTGQATAVHAPSDVNGAFETGGRTPADGRIATNETTTTTKTAQWMLVKHALVAIFATVFGIVLLSLQIWGLVAARNGLKTRDLTVNWCSPTFRDFALAITTGNCVKYDIIDSSSNGIGCIQLPASQQEEWLKGTVGALSISLLCEIIDVVLVRFARRTQDGYHRQAKGTRLRRPWCSLFLGPLVFVILIYYGVDTASNLPPGVTDLVWIYRKEPTADIGRVCQAHLRSPGLRGMIIGWTDGLFDSWGSVYHGKVESKILGREL